MNRESVIISDFKCAVNEKNAMSALPSRDTWEVKSYQTKNISGTFLFAGEASQPQELTVDPQLSGWYKIYVCMTDMHGCNNRIDLRLTDDEFSRCMRAGSLLHYTGWQTTERVEESFWKCADMTGQSVHISKSGKKGIPFRSNLFWLRFEPMTEEEIAVYKQGPNRTMIAHMDGDFHVFDAVQEPRDYCKALYAMKDSDVEIVCLEVGNDLIDYDAPTYDTYYPRSDFDKVRATYVKHASSQRESIYREMIQYAHGNNMQMFASHRMNLSTFCFPADHQYSKISFVASHPELRTQARDGSMCEFLSYAYKETQDFMLDTLLESAKQGFDGVHLLFTRGLSVLFEEPVVLRFEEKYGKETDYRRIPDSDPRLCEIRCDVMYEFFQRLRNALDEYASANGTDPLKVYIAVQYSVLDSIHDGLDIERLAKAKLIDGVIQSNMNHVELVDDVLAEDGLIDLEKYCEKAEREYVISRCIGNQMPKILEGIGEYRRIADTYDIRFYSEIQWENSVRPQEFVKGAKSVYAAGGQRIALWDCYPIRAYNLPEWTCTSRFGNKDVVANMPEDDAAYRNVYKVLSMDGLNMRFYHPSWRG